MIVVLIYTTDEHPKYIYEWDPQDQTDHQNEIIKSRISTTKSIKSSIKYIKQHQAFLQASFVYINI